MKKEIKKKLQELRDAIKGDEDISMILAISDKENVNTSFQGSIMSVANLLANFKGTDREFRMANSLSYALVKMKKATDKMMEETDDLSDFMNDVMGEVETKNGKKADC